MVTHDIPDRAVAVGVPARVIKMRDEIGSQLAGVGTESCAKETMDHLPLVSVGVPVYNGEDDLPYAVESLLAQSYSNLEIIISDNASTDRTEQIALELAARDRRVRYHRLERNIGAWRNFDQLRNVATGEYFMWNGADDIRPPNAIKLLVQALMKNPQAVMAHGPIIAKLGELEMHIPNEMDLSSAGSSQRVRVSDSQNATYCDGVWSLSVDHTPRRSLRSF